MHDARVSDDLSHVILTTDAQQPVIYHLTVQTSGTTSVASALTGSTNPEPQLQTAIALNNTQVLLTFDQPVAGGATTIAFYRIVVPGEDPTQDIGELRILGASLSADGMTVTLTTSPQKDLQYEVIVTNVAAKSGGMLIDPTQNTATFFGMPPVDITPPKLLSAASANQTTVILSFSEPMSLDTPDPTNFTVNPPLVITDAQLSLFNTQIILTTAPQEAGIDYTVTVAASVIHPNYYGHTVYRDRIASFLTRDFYVNGDVGSPRVPEPCIGDCNGDGPVTVDELLEGNGCAAG